MSTGSYGQVTRVHKLRSRSSRSRLLVLSRSLAGTGSLPIRVFRLFSQKSQNTNPKSYAENRTEENSIIWEEPYEHYRNVGSVQIPDHPIADEIHQRAVSEPVLLFRLNSDMVDPSITINPAKEISKRGIRTTPTLAGSCR